MTQGSVCSQGFVLYLVPPKRSGIPTGDCRPGLRLVIAMFFGVTVSIEHYRISRNIVSKQEHISDTIESDRRRKLSTDT